MAETVAEVRGFSAPGTRLDLDVRRGELVLVCGPNGSGKTSLLRLLAGLPAPLQAEAVTVMDRPAGKLSAAACARRLRLVTQDPRDGLVGLTVGGEFRLRGRAVPQDLAGLGEREVALLSSGEVRRVALAVGDAGGADLVLLDEPAEGLDAEGRARLLEAVGRARHGAAVVAADHLGVLAAVADRVVALAGAPVPPLPVVPRGIGAPIVTCPAAVVRRDGVDVALPAVRLGPGLHAAVGPNGSGKSTLLLHLAGLLGPGAVVAGRAPEPGRDARLLLPRAREALPGLTVAEELAGAEPEIASGLVPPELGPRHPLSLSGGQAQRVALAKVLGRPAPLFLLDEPEAHLDGAGRAALAGAVAQRVAQGSCVLAATHDPDLIAAAQGTVACGGPG